MIVQPGRVVQMHTDDPSRERRPASPGGGESRDCAAPAHGHSRTRSRPRPVVSASNRLSRRGWGSANAARAIRSPAARRWWCGVAGQLRQAAPRRCPAWGQPRGRGRPSPQPARRHRPARGVGRPGSAAPAPIPASAWLASRPGAGRPRWLPRPGRNRCWHSPELRPSRVCASSVALSSASAGRPKGEGTVGAGKWTERMRRLAGSALPNMAGVTMWLTSMPPKPSASVAAAKSATHAPGSHAASTWWRGPDGRGWEGVRA